MVLIYCIINVITIPTINSKNNHDKYFQYAVKVAWKRESTVKNPQRIPKYKAFVNQYGWKEISFPSHKKY